MIFRDCRFLNCSAGEGGVAYCRTTTARFLDCRFEGNVSGLEGGCIYCANGATPRIERCIFSGNAGSKGGAIASLEGSRPRAIDCTFEDGEATSGGAIYVFESSIELASCLLTGNHATSYGGACHVKTSVVQSLLTGCTLESNNAPSGGAVNVEGSNLAVSECTFAGNRSTNYGAGLRIALGSNLTMASGIVAFSTQGQALYTESTSPCQLSCCDLYGNAGGDWTGTIAGQLGQNGNISRDPLFCTTNPLLPYLLQAASPCAPGAGECGQIGAWPVGCGSPQEVAGSEIDSDRPLLACPVPSPFCTSARLAFTIPRAADGGLVRLDVLDAAGRRVRELVNAPGRSGPGTVAWDGRSADGQAAPGGVYFFLLEVGGRQAITRGVLVR